MCDFILNINIHIFLVVAITHKYLTNVNLICNQVDILHTDQQLIK